MVICIREFFCPIIIWEISFLFQAQYEFHQKQIFDSVSIFQNIFTTLWQRFCNDCSTMDYRSECCLKSFKNSSKSQSRINFPILDLECSSPKQYIEPTIFETLKIFFSGKMNSIFSFYLYIFIIIFKADNFF